MKIISDTSRFSVGSALLSLFFLVISVTPAWANEAGDGRSISVLNILFLGLIAYFLIRMFRRRSGDNDSTRPGQWSRRQPDDEPQGKVVRPMDRHEAARQAWSHLSSDEPVQAASSSVVQGAHDFNEEEFLEGAKLFFSRFQQARSQGDYDDLKSFMSDEVYAQAVADVGNGADVATEVMLLNARLMEMKSDNNRTSVSVFYDGQVRRGTQGERMEHLRAVWEFSRDDSEPGGLWILETINKVDQ